MKKGITRFFETGSLHKVPGIGARTGQDAGVVAVLLHGEEGTTRFDRLLAQKKQKWPRTLSIRKPDGDLLMLFKHPVGETLLPGGRLRGLPGVYLFSEPSVEIPAWGAVCLPAMHTPEYGEWKDSSAHMAEYPTWLPQEVLDQRWLYGAPASRTGGFVNR